MSDTSRDLINVWFFIKSLRILSLKANSGFSLLHAVLRVLLSFLLLYMHAHSIIFKLCMSSPLPFISSFFQPMITCSHTLVAILFILFFLSHFLHIKLSNSHFSFSFLLNFLYDYYTFFSSFYSSHLAQPFHNAAGLTSGMM